jgi:ABC-type antimicrobial peptide transport system permease subunit
MWNEYRKMAFASIRAAKFRSILTMFGIIIGVSSVVTIVSLGEGVKQQVTTQAGEISDSLIVIRPGKEQDASAFSLDVLRSYVDNNTGSLSEKDWRDTQEVENVSSSVPVGIVSGIATFEGTEYNGTIIASTARLPRLLNQQVEFGEYFTDSGGTKKKVAVIGRDVAEQLFGENVPIGKSLQIRGEKFIVQGVFAQQDSGTFAAINVNSSIMIPYESAKDIGGNTQILQIYVEAEDASQVEAVASDVRSTLIKNHAGQEDFTILEREEALEATNAVFYQLTIFTAGVAFISFIVGGIGIMNIMFATVSERTREIGIRKAIGATNSQILGQFVMESALLSILGGFFGVLLAFIANAIIRVTTDLQPVTTWQVVVIAAGLSIVTGIISGILPAAKAASKDPIASLRTDA